MSTTSIPWTERTWNPVTGCTKYSAGCQNCYAETMARRLKAMGQKKYTRGFHLTMHPDALDEPKKIKKPSMFFVCSMGDLFHDDVPYEFIDRVMQTVIQTPWHTYQLLTKRADNMAVFFMQSKFIPKNVWLGTTVENDQNLERIAYLSDLKYLCNAPVTFLSCEPLLSDLPGLDLTCIDWVIVGGESGPKARPMQKEWVLNIQRQCAIQKSIFFFKQWGTYGEDGIRRSTKANGYILNGQIYREVPNPLIVNK